MSKAGALFGRQLTDALQNGSLVAGADFRQLERGPYLEEERDWRQL